MCIVNLQEGDFIRQCFLSLCEHAYPFLEHSLWKTALSNGLWIAHNSVYWAVNFKPHPPKLLNSQIINARSNIPESVINTEYITVLTKVSLL